MIDEKKLIEDLIHNDGIEFNVRFDASTPEACANSAQQLVDKLKQGVVNLINRQPRFFLCGDFTMHKEQWISAKEQQPQNFVSVIINTPGDYPLPTVHEGYLTPDGIWITIYGEAYTMEEVPFWMPMPTPPKVGEGR